MKKILFFIGMLFSVCSYGQVKQVYNQYGGDWKKFYIRTGLRLPQSPVSTKDLNLPAMDTGQIYYNPADSSIYYHTGFQWTKINAAGGGGGGGGISQLGTSPYGLVIVDDSTYRVDTAWGAVETKLNSRRIADSLKALIVLKLNISDTTGKWISTIYRKVGSDSVFYKKNGVATFAFIDSTGGGSGTPAGNNTNVQFKRNDVFAGSDSLTKTASGVEVVGDLFTNRLTVTGNSNATQVLIKANATQSNSNPIFRLASSSGTPLLDLHSDNARNTFVGVGTGPDNVFVADVTGYDNTFIGNSAGLKNTTGFLNTIVGKRAFTENLIGARNTALGAGALQNNLTNDNISIGYHSSFGVTSGNQNTVVGTEAMFGDSSGIQNTVFGYAALQQNRNGSYNTAIGANALISNTSGGNIAIGANALYYAANAGSNLAVGINAGYNNITGEYNTYVGNVAGLNATGSQNVFLGFQAGYNETGSHKLYIANSTADNTLALLYGEFNNQLLRVNGNLGIFTSPVASAALDIVSTTRGVLLPRQTYAQRDAISSPATGLLMFNTQTNKYNYYDGSIWRVVQDSASGGGGGVTAAANGTRLSGSTVMLDNGSNPLSANVFIDGQTNSKSFSAFGSTVDFGAINAVTFAPAINDSAELFMGMRTRFDITTRTTSGTVSKQTPHVHLGTNASDQTITFPYMGVDGYVMVVQNTNTSAFNWNVAGAPLVEANGTSISIIPNKTISWYMWDDATGSATRNSWVRFSGGSGSPYFLNKSYANVDNSGTGETDLDTYTIPANTLSTNGDIVTFSYTVNLSDITATATIKTYFAGTATANTGALTVSATGAVIVKGEIIRTNTTTARASVSISSPTASTAVYTSETDLTGLDFTATNIIKITGQAGGAGGGSADITFKLGYVKFER